MTNCRAIALLCSFALFAACSNDGTTQMVTHDMAGNMNPSGDCPEPAGAGVTHGGELTADETWTAANSPHVVTSDLVVRGGHTLTIEECALVRVQGNSSIIVGANLASDGTGTLIAHGSYQPATASTAEVIRPVAFTADDQTAWWGSLQVFATGHADFSVVAIDRAGNPNQSQGGGGALLMRGDDNRITPVRNVKALLLVVMNSATYGINARASAGFTADSDGIVITGSGAQGSVGGGEDSRYAMYIETPSIQTLPTNSSIMGNTRDEILAHAPFTVAVDERFPALGVPYQLRDSFYMAPTTLSATITLTIDPGVTIKLGGPIASNPSFKLGSGSSNTNNYPVRLNAAGTAAKPIKITSGAAAPAAGDWGTIDWGGGPGAGNVMSYVTIEYGGGDSQTNGFGCGPGDNDSLLLITDWQPNDAFVQNCTFQHSASGGIVSGWASDTAGPNLKTGNTFTDIASTCQVSQPKNAAGMCPGNDSTPDCY